MTPKLAHTDHPIHELLQKRWSPRAFADKAVEPAKLRSLLEAARWAPSSFNEQPWAFFVATREQPEAYAQLLGCLMDFNQSWAKAAPVLMLTAAHRRLTKNDQENRHSYHDLGQAVANLTMQATAEGLVVHQMAGILPEKAHAALALPPDWDVVTALAIGYLGDPNTLTETLRQRELASATRKPLGAFVFTGKWGSVAEVVR